jgi:hypothetical protein
MSHRGTECQGESILWNRIIDWIEGTGRRGRDIVRNEYMERRESIITFLITRFSLLSHTGPHKDTLLVERGTKLGTYIISKQLWLAAKPALFIFLSEFVSSRHSVTQLHRTIPNVNASPLAQHQIAYCWLRHFFRLVIYCASSETYI